MIRDQIIEGVLEELEHADFEKQIEGFNETYPVLQAYLLNDQLKSLTHDEFMLLFFNALVIAKCFESIKCIPEQIDPSILEEAESKNWSMLENTKPQGFRDKLDVFFETSTQEDLLAFIEDSLADDEDLIISSAVKEILFVFSKSILDTFVAYSDTSAN